VFTIKEILDLAVRLERNGETAYRNAATKMSNPALVSLLEWMANEEVQHAKWFTELKKNLKKTSSNPVVEEMSRELFNQLLDQQNFSLNDVNFSQVEQIDELITIFIEFEKDTVLFYEMLQPFIEDKNTLQQLENIIAEENCHIRELRKLKESKVAASESSD
jgi:rubrerythrin